MTFDLAGHLGAMVRTVRELERDGRPARAVIAWRIYDTDAADLWDAVTRPERLARWFAPVTGELVLGGRYQVEGNAGGTITACEPERRIELTWEFAGVPSWVTVTLTPEGEGTRLELEHVAHVSPHWDTYGAGATGVGWDLAFMGLARHLAEPQAAVAQEALAGWFASPEALDFIRTTSDDWGRAAIGGGADPDWALKAAEATRKFYSGEPPTAQD